MEPSTLLIRSARCGHCRTSSSTTPRGVQRSMSEGSVCPDSKASKRVVRSCPLASTSLWYALVSMITITGPHGVDRERTTLRRGAPSRRSSALQIRPGLAPLLRGVIRIRPWSDVSAPRSADAASERPGQRGCRYPFHPSCEPTTARHSSAFVEGALCAAETAERPTRPGAGATMSLQHLRPRRRASPAARRGGAAGPRVRARVPQR